MKIKIKSLKSCINRDTHHPPRMYCHSSMVNIIITDNISKKVSFEKNEISHFLSRLTKVRLSVPSAKC